MTRPSWGGFVIGGVLLVLGAVWLLNATDVVDVDADVALAGLVVLIGLAVIAAPRGGGRAVLIVFGILVALAAAAATLVDPGRLDDGIGDRTETPRTAADVHRYKLGIGQLTVDLTRLNVDARIEASIGIGELDVIVPGNAALEVDAELGAGNVRVRDEEHDGTNVDVKTSSPGSGPRFELELDGGIGQIAVG
jgi:hypothetical protein